MWTRRLRKPAAPILCLGGLLAGVLAGPPRTHAQEPEAAESRVTWWGPDGTPLPFETDDPSLQAIGGYRSQSWTTRISVGAGPSWIR